MSGNQGLTNAIDEEEYSTDHDIIYRDNNLIISSDINKKLFKPEACKCKKVITKKPNVKPASVNADLGSVIDMINTYDRPGDAYTQSTYAGAGTYADPVEDKPGKRIPKAGVYAEAGVGRARAEYSVFEAEAKGPNAAAGAEASVDGVGAMARAEIASASAKAGPVRAKLALGVDTGVSVDVNGFEAKVLGTGFSIGPKTSTGISFLGSEVSCKVL